MEKDPSHKPQPYLLHEDPLLTQQAETDKFLATKLDHLAQAEKFVSQAEEQIDVSNLDTYNRMRDLAEEDLQEHIRAMQYETSEPSSLQTDIEAQEQERKSAANLIDAENHVRELREVKENLLLSQREGQNIPQEVYDENNALIVEAELRLAELRFGNQPPERDIPRP